MKECITHHYACDCREEWMQKICAAVLKEHKEFCQLFESDPCDCDICKTILGLYPNLENEAIDNGSNINA